MGKSLGEGTLIDRINKYKGSELNSNHWYLNSFSTNAVLLRDIVNASTLASGTGNNKGLASYNNAKSGATGWEYKNESSDDYQIDNRGYAIKVSNVNDKYAIATKNNIPFYSFSSSGVIGMNVSRSNAWLLLGNPYLASMAANSNAGFVNFLSQNINNLDPEHAALYFWNPETTTYEVINNSSNAKYIDRQEAFFIMGKKNVFTTPVSFSKYSVLHNPIISDKQINTKTSIVLTANTNNTSAKTIVNYIENTTNGLDIGYDAGVFNAEKAKLSVGSYLAEGKNNTPLAIQCVPKQTLENSTIALTIKAQETKEVTIKATSNNLPKGVRILLEDKQTNTITDLTDANSSYTVTLATKENNNRFYLHTTAKALSTEEIALNKINIVKIDANTLQLKGLKDNATVSIYNVQGKLITNQKATVNATKIHIPFVATGVYLVTIKTATQQTTKKIIL